MSEPTSYVACHRLYDKGTSRDVIGVFGLRTGVLLSWKCPFCGVEWDATAEQRHSQLLEDRNDAEART